MAANRQTDERDYGRRRVLRGGTIAFSGRQVTLPCVVRDISDGGARLQLEHPLHVPDTFELIVELDGLEIACATMWRGARDIGVAFVGTPSYVAPKRAQVIGSLSMADVERDVRRAVRRQPNIAPPIAMKPMSPEAPSPDLSTGQQPVKGGLVLIAEDDPDDRMMLAEAFESGAFRHPVSFVNDGEDLLRALRGDAPYTTASRPDLILLDLNMPRMDGRTALLHLKADPELKKIPVVVLTTSSAEEDIQRTYQLGVSAFVTKPNSIDDMTELVKSIDTFWMRRVAFPTAA